MITDVKEVMLCEMPAGAMVQLSQRGRWWKIASIEGDVYKLVSGHSFHIKHRKGDDRVWIGAGHKMTELQQQVLDRRISQNHYSKQIALVEALQKDDRAAATGKRQVQGSSKLHRPPTGKPLQGVGG